MFNKISLNRVSELTGISKGSIESYIKDKYDDPEYKLLDLEKEKGKFLFDEKDIEKVVVFYIYKSSQTVAPSQGKNTEEENSRGETKELIKKFNEKYNEQEPLGILSEVNKAYNGIYHLFKESKETNSFDEKIKKYIEMIALISINLDSQLVERDKIKKDILSIKDYKYDRTLKGERPTSIKFTEETLNKIFKTYREAYSHYFKQSTLNDYEILAVLQEQQTSFNSETKLLKEHREYFSFFKEELGGYTNRDLWENKKALEEIKQEFYIKSKAKFEEIFGDIYNTVKELELLEIYGAFEPIRKKMEKLSDSQKKFYSDLPLRNYSDMFMCIDEVLDFYNSPQGKLLNEYFKKHNTMVEFFEHIKQYTSYSDYYKGNIDNIKLSLTRDIRFPMRCIGYDFEYKYHMIHDAFQLIKSPEKMKKANITEEKLLESVSKVLSHGNFNVNSRYQGGNLLEKAIATNNPEAVKVLRGYIDEVEEAAILSACYDQADTEGMIRSVLDCIPDTKINTKAYYQAIYEGNYKLVDALMESVEPISKKYPIEMYLCVVGKNPQKVSEVLMANIDKYSESEEFFLQTPTKVDIKLSFIEISILWGREDIVRENISFLESVDRGNPLLEKILALLLRRNYLDTFEKVFKDKGFDSSRICYVFIDQNGVPSTEITEETWEYLFKDAFKEIDINKAFSNTPSHCSRPHEATIEGLAKENFHFTHASMIFLEKLYKETTNFKMAFGDVKEQLERNPEESVLCYMGLEEEYEKNPVEYLKNQKEELKKFEANWTKS